MSEFWSKSGEKLASNGESGEKARTPGETTERCSQILLVHKRCEREVHALPERSVDFSACKRCSMNIQELGVHLRMNYALCLFASQARLSRMCWAGLVMGMAFWFRTGRGLVSLAGTSSQRPWMPLTRPMSAMMPLSRCIWS